MNSPESSFILKPSQRDINGVGCFAVKTISKGTRLEVLGELPTRKLSLEEIPDSHLKYCPLLESGDFLAPANFARMAVFWYINHDRGANVIADRWRLFADRNIKPGEELTLYYPDLITHPKNKEWVIPELHI